MKTIINIHKSIIFSPLFVRCHINGVDTPSSAHIGHTPYCEYVKVNFQKWY